MSVHTGLTAPAVAAKGPRGHMNLLVLAIVVAAVGALTPVWTQDMPFVLALASHAVIAAILALSLDMLTGNTGLLSFGHAGWYGFGSYVAGLLAKHATPEILLVLPLSIAAAALLAVIVGQILTRQVGKTFAILTLAFSQILYALVFVASAYTGGEDGLQGIPIPTVIGVEIVAPSAWFWILYSTLVAALACAIFVRRSPLGRAWIAIKENTERAQFVGINVLSLKLLAYVVSACLAALAGGLFALFNGATSPETLHWFESGKILMYVVLGGIGTIVGPAIGAAVFTFAEHYVSSLTDSWLIYFGGLFVVIVIVAPGGIFGLLQPLWNRFVERLPGAAP